MGSTSQPGVGARIIANRHIQGFVVVALVATLIVAVMASIGAASEAQPIRARAEPTGAAEVPPVDTEASGLFRMRVDDDYAQFRLSVFNISGITQAHIHHGAPGENGPVVAFLFGFADPATGPVNGLL